MRAQSRVCLGLPLYNQTTFLELALDSLLAQSYRHFELIIVDDSTIERPGEIARRYAATDTRIRYIRNPVRKGLVANWTCCFMHAARADYFAWVSDHDIWAPRWLATLVATLERYPAVVLAFPAYGQINAHGIVRARKSVAAFSTDGLSSTLRVIAICRDARHFGKMVYGLYRTGALRKAGVFRRVLFPDVVLLSELSLQGDFKQVEARLWYLRRLTDFSILRQKNSLFVRKPWYIHLPWPVVNTTVLAWHTALRPGAGAIRCRLLGLLVSSLYFSRWIGKLGAGSRIGSFRDWKKGRAPWMTRLLRYARALKVQL